MNTEHDTHRATPHPITTAPVTGAATSFQLTAWAGIAGPLLFTASFLMQEAFHRDEYNPVAEVVSALEAGPDGWIQQATFVVFGVFTMAHAVGLHRAVAPSRFGIGGPVLLFATGVGSIVSGVFPLREDASGATYDPGGHLVGGMLFFLGTPLAFMVLSARLRRDPRWRPLARYALIAGVTLVVSAAVMSVLVIPDEAALHEYAGLAQRLVVLILIFPLRIALGVRQLTAQRGPSRRN